MAVINQAQINQMIAEIGEQDEVGRRAEMHKRLKIYRDGGREYLIEQLEREFSMESIAEFRINPMNFLKTIVNRRSSLYRRSPIRSTGEDKDQALLDFYVTELSLNESMLKAHRYFNLFGNTALYVVPHKGILKLIVTPPHLYSVQSDMIDKGDVSTWVFSAFQQSGTVTQHDDIPSATGKEGWNRDKSFKSQGDIIASEQRSSGQNAPFYIFWTDEQHFTTNDQGKVFIPEGGEEAMINPLGMAPVVNLAKDRDSDEVWARWGDDTVSLCLDLQLGFSDLSTIAKHQGFGHVVFKSTEEPRNLTLGLNKAIWLRQKEGQPDPSMEYIHASPPISEHKDLLLDKLAILLSINDMSPNEVGGRGSVKSVNSGFQAMIEMMPTLEAIEADKPALRDAELQLAEIFKRYHNWMFDNNLLRDDARALGKFTDDFEMSLTYPDVRPLESDQERIGNAKTLIDMGLITKKDALKKIDPDMTDEQIDEKLEEIESGKLERQQKFMATLTPPAPPVAPTPEVEEES